MKPDYNITKSSANTLIVSAICSERVRLLQVVTLPISSRMSAIEKRALWELKCLLHCPHFSPLRLRIRKRITHLSLLNSLRWAESIPTGYLFTPEDTTMPFLLNPTVCEVSSGKTKQRARYSTYRASAAGYFAGHYLRLHASESAYY